MKISNSMRAAAYCRFSSSNQREESIDAQLRAIYKYMDEHEYTPVGDYIDMALTGTNTDRPNFQRMIEDAKKGLFDVVIVHKMDRFSRNVRDTLNIESELAQYGVKVISVIEQFADTPEGQLQQIIQLGVGQYYSQNLAREVMKGLRENAYKCLHNGGLPPLGYDVDPITKQYIINEKEAESIRIIFKKFLEGWSYRELAEYLNVLGYRTKIGNKFSANSSFYDILVNSKYKGEYVFGRSLSKPKHPGMKRSHRKNKDESEIIRVPNGLPAIIDEGTFEQVQKLLASRQRSKGASKAKEVYLVSGLIECGQCGSAYHGSARIGGRNKQKYVSYRCSKRKKIENPCKCKEINRTLLDNFIVQKVNEKLKQKFSEMDHDLPKLEKQLAEVNQKASNLVQAIAAGGLGSIDTITAELQRLEQQKIVLTNEIQNHQMKQTETNLTLDQMKEVLEEAKEFVLKNNDDRMKYILSRFIHKIIVKDTAIEVNYNLGGFFVEFNQVVLIETKVYSKKVIYVYSPLKEVS
ncbi:recombinase family protein [Turicibacter sanguinis]|uniref:recombinase family protein n=1 Tax=Turicibacter sanguinis TaxID=154288 RepID=UPI00325BA3F1